MNLTVAPTGGASKPGIAKVQISTKELEPGSRGSGMVSLTTPAPAEGVVVTFSADQALAVSQPVTVASGATSATFSFTVAADTGEGTASITANANGTSSTDVVRILPTLAIVSVELKRLNNDFTATVVLNREPLSGDAKVSLSLAPAASGTLPTPPELLISKGTKQGDMKGSFTAATASGKVIAILGKSRVEKAF